MKIVQEVTESDAWDAFVAAQPFAQFLQSWAWGEFRMSEHGDIRRWALKEDERWLAVMQMEYRARRFGTGYWFAPRGPIFAYDLTADEKRDAMFALCEHLLTVNELRQKTVFWRVEPMSELSNPEGLVPLSFYRTSALNPASTRVIDLHGADDELLKGMREKTRYNIRVAEKHGVTVRATTHAADLAIFLTLMDETATRDKFVLPLPYLARTFSFLASRGMATLRVAEHGGKILAAQMEIFFGDTVTYLYGASSSQARNVMAPYALHWHAIRDAKARGFALYDMWGANPEWQGSFYYKASWEGITRFKRGFGGRQIDFVGTWDLPINRALYAMVNWKHFFRG